MRSARDNFCVLRGRTQREREREREEGGDIRNAGLTIFPLHLHLAEGNPLHDEILHPHFRCSIEFDPGENALFNSRRCFLRDRFIDYYRASCLLYTVAIFFLPNEIQSLHPKA